MVCEIGCRLSKVLPKALDESIQWAWMHAPPHHAAMLGAMYGGDFRSNRCAEVWICGGFAESCSAGEAGPVTTLETLVPCAELQKLATLARRLISPGKNVWLILIQR